MDNTENAHSTNPLDLPGINDDPTAAQREVYLAKPDLQVTPTSDPNPWIPIQNPLDLKHLGKLIEELNEAGSATARCIIQGIDEVEPVTKKSNRTWLQEELADVIANINLVIEHFKLNVPAIEARIDRKYDHLKKWHNMLNNNDHKLD
jgi:hypothetical protein